MKFKPGRVKLVKEIGSITLEMFVSEFQKYCDAHLISSASVHKFDMSLLRQLCNVIENAYEKKNEVDEKLDKKKTVIDEYVRLKQYANFLYSPDEMKILKIYITQNK